MPIIITIIIIIPLFVQTRWASGKSVCLRSCKLGFDSESGSTNDFKLVFTAASLIDIQH